MTKPYVKPKYIRLKDHQKYDEKWVQDLISENPSILRLGNLDLVKRERRQSRGRLDLLLQDPDSPKRYEVELQLGEVDASHIIRTIGYWDEENRLLSQYDHCAVLIAEDMGRFFNVISLLNRAIPIIAIQMQALLVNDHLTLVFTQVIKERPLGSTDEDEDASAEPTDRKYWETRATEKTVGWVDQMLRIIRESDPQLDLKYNKYYIGLEKDGRASNFVKLIPIKNRLKFEIYLPKDDDFDQRINDAGFDALPHSGRAYQLRLTKEEIESRSEVLKELSRSAYKKYFG